MKRIIFGFILSVILVGMSIPVLLDEHGRGGERGRGHARGHDVSIMEIQQRILQSRSLLAAPVYAPPPAYYAPDPYPPPGINFVIPLHIR